MSETKPRRGRPPKPPNERRPHTLTIRVNDELYQLIRHEAEANGRSMSEEAEVLLHGAFDARARAHEVLVGMVARGEVLLQPKSSPGSPTEMAAVAETPPALTPGSAEFTSGVFSGVSSEMFSRMCDVVMAAFRGDAVAAAARDMIRAAVREVHEEAATASRSPRDKRELE